MEFDIIPLPEAMRGLPFDFKHKYAECMLYSETAARHMQNKLAGYEPDGTDLAESSRADMAKGSCRNALMAQEKRMNHALKRLKEKKLWADSFEGIEQILLGHNDARGIAIIQIMHYGLGDKTFSARIQDSTWKLGIELTMMLKEPDLFLSGNMLASALERNLDLLYPIVMLLATGIHVNARMADYVDYIETHEETMIHMDSIRDAIFDVIAQNDALESKSAADGKAHAEAMDKIRIDLNKVSRRAGFLEEQSERQAERIKILEQELAAKTEELESARALLAETFPEVEKAVQEQMKNGEESETLPELPETGIVFVGGHTNLIKKVKQVHPDWRYIAARDKATETDIAADMIFVWYKHLAHTVYDKIKIAAETAGAKLVYLESTNLDNLETEMRRAWMNMGRG